ncbi:MAG: Phage terminase, small subunit [Betaproteobacteria bacterium]|nr:Phage terminase, small subunit [Betaproteobacteria bacterium]
MTATLTDRQERFVNEYLFDQNATAAAVRAGYSVKTRGAQAAALMNNPLVRHHIVIALRDLFATFGITPIKLLRAQANAAFFDPGKLLDAEGNTKPLRDLDEDTRTALTVSYDLRSDGKCTVRVRQPVRHIAIAALEKSLDHYTAMEIKALEALMPEPDESPASEPQAEIEAEPETTPPHPWGIAPSRPAPAPQPAATFPVPDAIPFRSRAAQLLFGNRPSEDGVPRTTRR